MNADDTCDACKVTVYDRGLTGSAGAWPTCDEPVVAHGLCAEHYADRLRLGGTP